MVARPIYCDEASEHLTIDGLLSHQQAERCLDDLPEELIRDLVLMKLHAVGLRNAARLTDYDRSALLARRKMGVGELAERIGITPTNLAVLKNGRAKAVRFTTLEALCEVLECQPGDLLEYVED